MSNWILRWNYDKATYSPSESALINFWLENTGYNDLYLSELEIQFDFGLYKLDRIVGKVSPRENKPLGNVRILLPNNIVGKKLFSLQYHIWEYSDDSWIDLGVRTSEKRYFVSIYPSPLYNVFVSRGIRTEDKAIGDPIVEMIKEWGFKTTTVGIEVQSSNGQVPIVVREEIKKADALIAIATPRYLDSITDLWKTLEWLHAEVGIGFGLDKPLLILKDNSVNLSGLPSYLVDFNAASVIEYEPSNVDIVRSHFSTIMPGFREWVENKRNQEFKEGLGRLLVGGLAVVGGFAIVSGIVGYLTDTSKK